MALRSVGRWDDALRTMNEALDLYEALGRAEAIGRLSLGDGVPADLEPRVRRPSGRPARPRGPGDVASADRARLLAADGLGAEPRRDHESATATFEQGARWPSR